MEISDTLSNHNVVVYCHTNNNNNNNRNIECFGTAKGDWIAPDGSRVDDVPGFFRDTGRNVVMLKMYTGTPPEGIYHCSVPDGNVCKPDTVYVGLYNNGGGFNTH